VVLALADAGAEQVAVLNRTPERAATAAALAGPVGWPVPSGDEARLQAIRSADLVVNATPFGMEGASPVGTAPWLVAPDLLHPGQVAADLVYAPRPTPWLIGAAAAGARSVDGLGMLVHQAAAQLVLWTGEDAPVEAMWQAAEAVDPPRDPAVPGAPAP
jgi:shikimate dehydrogenase